MSRESSPLQTPSEIKAARRSKTDAERRFLREFSTLAKMGAALVIRRSAIDQNASLAGIAPEGAWSSWSDGGHSSKTDRMTAGGALHDSAGAPVALFSNLIPAPKKGKPCSSYAEFAALDQALAVAVAAGAKKLHAHFDCQSILATAASMACGHAGFDNRPFAKGLRSSAIQLDELILSWVPREENAHADSLAGKAARKALRNDRELARKIHSNPPLACDSLPPPPIAPLASIELKGADLRGSSPSLPKTGSQGAPGARVLSAVWLSPAGPWAAACARHNGARWEEPSLWGLGQSSLAGPEGLQEALRHALLSALGPSSAWKGHGGCAVAMDAHCHKALGQPLSLRALLGPSDASLTSPCLEAICVPEAGHPGWSKIPGGSRPPAFASPEALRDALATLPQLKASSPWAAKLSQRRNARSASAIIGEAIKTASGWLWGQKT